MSTQPALPLEGITTEHHETLLDTLNPSVASLALSVVSQKQSRLLALCMEPDLGGEDILDSLIEAAREKGIHVKESRYLAVSPESASRRLVQMANLFKCTKDDVVIVLRYLPPSDESHVARQVKAIRKLLKKGARVIMWLLPEARQLLESLPECVVFGASEITSSEVLEAKIKDPLYDAYRFTRGIPSLLVAFKDLHSVSGFLQNKNTAYYERLNKILFSTLRNSLTIEEQRLRLCMLLLGEGRTDDLKTVLQRADDSYLTKIQKSAPLYGISEDLSTFSCIATLAVEIPTECEYALKSLCLMYPDLCAACEEFLLSKRRIQRAAELAKISTDPRLISAIIASADKFIESGKLNALEIAIEAGKRQGSVSFESIDTLRKCIDYLSYPHDLFVKEYKTLKIDQTNLPTDIGLYCACRDCLLCERVVDVKKSVNPDKTQEKLLLHLQVMNLMMQGRLKDSMSLLMTCTTLSLHGGVSDILLKLDLELVKILLLESSGCDPQVLDEATRLFCSGSLKGFRGYIRIIRIVELLLFKQITEETLEEIEDICTDLEGPLVEICSCLAGCICDLRRKNYVRAYIRSDLAYKYSNNKDLEYPSYIAQMLEVVVAYYLNQSSAYMLSEHEADTEHKMILLFLMVVANKVSLKDPGIFANLQPADDYWILYLLMFMSGEFSGELAESVPRAWIEVLENFDKKTEKYLPQLSLSEERRTPKTSVVSRRFGQSRNPIEVCLLGSFEVRVEGECLSLDDLQQRSSDELLELLLLSEGVRMQRYKIADELWPHKKYELAFTKIYQATHYLRQLFSKTDPTLDPFISKRGSNSLALKKEMIYCDVFELRKLASELFVSRDDRKTLDLAKRIDNVYRGDLVMLCKNTRGMVASALVSARNLYIDAMLAGARAAERLSKENEAVRLISRASALDETREDVIRYLIDVLRKSGRNTEAERYYRKYIRNIVL